MTLRCCAKVVLGVPVYNERAHLQECLESIASQDCSDFAVVVSDNASTDGSAAIAENFCRHNNRFHFVRQETNRGAAVNFAECFLQSSSLYFGFVGAHDLLKAHHLSTHLSELEQRPSASLSFTPWEYIDERGMVQGHVPDRLLPSTGPADDCPWQRVLWSVRNHAVGSGLWSGLFRRSHMPRPPYPPVGACDHLLLTQALFNGPAIERPGYTYQERIFRKKVSGYMERITGEKRSRVHLTDIYREYMRWYDSLPHSSEWHAYRSLFRRSVIRKCVLTTSIWGRINGLRVRLGLAAVR